MNFADMIEIKRLDNTSVIQLEVPEGTLVHRELMGDHYVKIPFSVASPIYFQLGDWCNISGFGRFELTDLYSPKYNTTTGGYDYELQLDAYYIKWKNKVCKYLPQSAASETSFHLTATIDVHLSVIVNNINALGAKDSNFLYEGSTFTYSLRNISADKTTAAKYKQYSNTDIISALNDLATIYDCEWWVEDNIICFGRCELDGEEIDFTIDENVVEMSGDVSKKAYATRLYVFGSTRNIPSNYRADASADVTQNGVIQKRLMLPLNLCPNGCVEDSGITETGAVEAVVVDDDIYPRVNCGVGSIETYEKTVEDEETGEEITRTYYRIHDNSGFNFSSDYILEGETLRILFTSGNMNGMDFECQYNDDEEYYEVVANEDYGRFLPDTSLHPQVGDTFVVYNWDATRIAETGIITAAEQELYTAALSKLATLKIDPNTYTCKMMSDVYEEEMEAQDGSYSHYDFGQRVRLVNPAYFMTYRSSRIIGYEIKLDIPYDEPQYIVGEAMKYSHTEDMQGQIDAITYNGVTYQSSGGGSIGGVYIITTTSTTPSSDTNVYSAKRSDKQFLRKDVADTARGRVTFASESQHNNGIQIGTSYIAGLAGVGGKIDGNANAELESLTLRSWLEVPELRYNKVSIYTGIRWDTFGGGIIESITPTEGAQIGSGVLKLEDGEYGAIAVGDLCMGIWHDESENATADSDDKVGNFTFAGFKTVYFQITGVSGSHNENFTYLLRSTLDGGNGVHPFAGMHFAGRGNDRDTSRQAFTYTTTEYSLALAGVSTWEFQSSNYLEIRGKIEGFSMPATDSEGHTYTKVFHGYGQVFGNAYVFGQIDTFERQAYKMVIDQSKNGSLAPNETETVTCTIYNGYGDDVTSQFTLFTVTRNTGDAASDAVWNADHTNVGNPFAISFNDLGIDGINKVLAVFNVVATDEANDETTNQTIDYYS